MRLLSSYTSVKDVTTTHILKRNGDNVKKNLLSPTAPAFFFFFYLNDISPGSSHPSIQCDARSLTGDLPTTAPLTTAPAFARLTPSDAATDDGFANRMI